MKSNCFHDADARATKLGLPARHDTGLASIHTATQRSLRDHTRCAAKIANWICGAFLVAFVCSRIALWLWAGALATLISTMAFGQQASRPIPVSKPHDPEITFQAEIYRQAVLHADAAKLATLYRDDAVEMPPFHAPIVGRAAIGQFYQGMFTSPARVSAFKFTHLDTSQHGDVAYNVGTYTRTVAAPPSASVESTGSYSVILKRTGGLWRIAYMLYNCACPPGLGSAGTHASN